MMEVDFLLTFALDAGLVPKMLILTFEIKPYTQRQF